jgi:hypothetical protein
MFPHRALRIVPCFLLALAGCDDRSSDRRAQVPTTAPSSVGAEVAVEEFNVPRDQVDAAVTRLMAKDFANVARPALTVLARQKPAFLPAGRDPRMSDAEYEAFRRRIEAPAYTVARAVIASRGADPKSEEVVGRVLGEIATDQSIDADIRLLAIQGLASTASSKGTLTENRRDALCRVAVHDKDDPSLRVPAAEALLRVLVPPVPMHGGGTVEYSLLLHVPRIIRAQPTLAARHAAFSQLTNLGNRVFNLPHDRFVELIRVGFDLIEETPKDAAEGAYFTATQLGYMLKRPDGFKPPQAEHKGADGNLAPSFFVKTVENAREWWQQTGRHSIDALAPQPE